MLKACFSRLLNSILSFLYQYLSAAGYHIDRLTPAMDDNKYGVFIHVDKLDRINGEHIFTRYHNGLCHS